MSDTRDIVDPYVAEALYEETIAWNVDMRGGTASASEWPSWEELPDMAREHWMSMAVTARVATRAALESANSADLIAAVRRGVESGTIEGEVVETTWGRVKLVIPVSDGGSET